MNGRPKWRRFSDWMIDSTWWKLIDEWYILVTDDLTWDLQ